MSENESTTSHPQPNDDDFDSFLRESEQKEAIQRQNQEKILELTNRLTASLTAHGVRPIVFPDHTLNQEEVTSYRQMVLAEVRQSEGNLEPEEEDELVEWYVQDYRERTGSLYMRIAMSILSQEFYNKPLSPEAISEKTKTKAHIIGRWVLENGLDINSEWVRFLNDVLPGDSLDEMEIGKEIIEITESIKEQQQNSIRAHAAEQANLTDLFRTSSPEDISELIDLATFASKRNSADVNEKVHELARQYDVKPEQIYAYIASIQKNLNS